MICLCFITVLITASPLPKTASFLSPRLFVSPSPSLPLSSTILGPARPTDADKAIDQDQAAEILASDDAWTQHRIDKFLQLVVLPFALVLALILLLRRGLFS